MKFIRLKVKDLNVLSPRLVQLLVQEPFALSLSVPLPDPHFKTVVEQKGTLRNYEILSQNKFAFNSLSLYNFRIDELTLSQFVNTSLKIDIPEYQIYGQLNMNKLIMSHDFDLRAEMDLYQKIKTIEHIKVEGKRKLQEQEVETEELVANVLVEINLQSGDSEDELKRNF